MSKSGNDWLSTTTGELCDYITSGSRDWRSYYSADGALFIRTQDINQDRLNLNAVAHVNLPEKVEGKRSRVQPGDLLVTITGANVGKVALVPTDIPEAYVSQSVGLMRLKDKRNAPYLHYYLQSEQVGRKHLLSLVYGMGRPVLSLQNLRDIPVELPSIGEQLQIVDKIEKDLTRIEVGLAALQRVQANLKRYRASVLKAAYEGKLVPTDDELARGGKVESNFETGEQLIARIEDDRRMGWHGRGKYKEPDSPDTTQLPHIPQGWAWATVEQLAAHEPNSITDGPFGSNLKTEHYVDSGPRVIRLQNIGDGIYIDAEAHISEAHFERLRKHRVFANDVVVAGFGENPPRACIIPESLGPAIVKADCIRFKPHQNIASKYINAILNSQPIRKRLKSLVHGVGRPRLNLGEIKSITLPIPPYNEQLRIVSALEERLTVVTALETALAVNVRRAFSLKQSILKTAFFGDL